MSDEPTVFDPENPNRAWTVCFYSYRGGVGRTTLAVTTAFGLFERACLLDFDLEAPGVDEFDYLRPKDENQPGLVEYVSAYVQSGSVPNIRDYVYLANERRPDDHPFVVQDKQSLLLGKDRPPPMGYVMRAGRKDRAYCKFLAEFDWAHFYGSRDGYLFFENLRAGIKQEFGCDFLIVDSRTGLTHIGGVCIGHLADAVVLVFQPSKAHAAGMKHIAQVIVERQTREARPIPRLYVASKMPQSYDRTPDPEAEAIARDIVRGCEPLQTVNWVDPLGKDTLQDIPVFEVGVGDAGPTLLVSYSRGRIQSPHKPDSYVAVTDNFSARDEHEYVADFLFGWIEQARKDVCDHVELESLKADASAFVRRLASLPYYRFRQLLDAKRTQLLLESPRDILAELPESHVDELKAAAVRYKLGSK